MFKSQGCAKKTTSCQAEWSIPMRLMSNLPTDLVYQELFCKVFHQTFVDFHEHFTLNTQDAANFLCMKVNHC